MLGSAILTVPQQDRHPGDQCWSKPYKSEGAPHFYGITTKICSSITVVFHDPIEKSVRLVSDDKMDPLLEISIDYSRSPVVVRLDGVLDGTTRSAFLSVLGDLMLEGAQTVVIDAGAVIVDASGAEALALCHERFREASRILIWDGVDFAPRSSNSSGGRSFPSRQSSTSAR